MIRAFLGKHCTFFVRGIHCVNSNLVIYIPFNCSWRAQIPRLNSWSVGSSMMQTHPILPISSSPKTPDPVPKFPSSSGAPASLNSDHHNRNSHHGHVRLVPKPPTPSPPSNFPNRLTQAEQRTLEQRMQKRQVKEFMGVRCPPKSPIRH